MSQVWLTHEVQPGPPLKLSFRGDSDAHIVKGLVALLFMILSNRTPREILDTDVSSVFSRLGLDNQITVNRRNGFYAMVERIKGLARTHAPPEPASHGAAR
jgi:cysteine desulfuration protein SufE